MAKPGEEENLAMLDFLQGLNAPALSAFTERERRRVKTPHITGSVEQGTYNLPTNYRGEVEGAQQLIRGMGRKPVGYDRNVVEEKDGQYLVFSHPLTGDVIKRERIGGPKPHENSGRANAEETHRRKWGDVRTAASVKRDRLMKEYGESNLKKWLTVAEEAKAIGGVDMTQDNAIELLLAAGEAGKFDDEKKRQLRIGADYLKAQMDYDTADIILKDAEGGGPSSKGAGAGTISIWGPKK
jgi:hypothetical protein